MNVKWHHDPILRLILIVFALWSFEGYLLFDARFRLISAEEKIQALKNKVQQLQAYELSHMDVRKRLEELEGKVK